MHNFMYPPLYHHTEEFHCPKNPLCSIYSSFPPSQSQVPGNYWYFYCLYSCVFSRMHIFGVTQYVTFSDWFPSLGNVYVKFFHAFLRPDSAFLLSMSDVPLHDYTTICLSICPLNNFWLRSSVGSWFLCGYRLSIHSSK